MNNHTLDDLTPGVVMENANTGKRVRIHDVTTYPGSIVVNWGQSADDKVSLPITASVFYPGLGWFIVEPYVCGTCGHRFYEDTPAGRCPKEADHEDDDHEPTYNVYALWEGTVDAEESFDDFDDAVLKFAEMVKEYTTSAEHGQLTADVTVHLYHPGFGTMECERHISAHA